MTSLCPAPNQGDSLGAHRSAIQPGWCCKVLEPPGESSSFTLELQQNPPILLSPNQCKTCMRKWTCAGIICLHQNPAKLNHWVALMVSAHLRDIKFCRKLEVFCVLNLVGIWYCYNWYVSKTLRRPAGTVDNHPWPTPRGAGEGMRQGCSTTTSGPQPSRAAWGADHAWVVVQPAKVVAHLSAQDRESRRSWPPTRP